MSDKIPFDFDEYIRQSEPDKQQKGYIWQTAIGLQDVDGLKPSEYLIETAKKNIDGDIKKVCHLHNKPQFRQG